MGIKFDEFQKLDKEEWIVKINKDLKGKKISSDLRYIVEDEFSIDPYLTSEDQKFLEPLIAPKTRSGFKIKEKDSSRANKIGLKFLENGAQSLFFIIDDQTDFEVLFEGIMLEMITVVLDFKNAGQNMLLSLTDFISKEYSNTDVDIILANKYDNRFSTIVDHLKADDKFLVRLSKFIRSIISSLEKDKENNFAISLELKTDFLAQIAEIRAIRILWANILDMYNIKEHIPIRIICEVDNAVSNQSEINPLIKINYQMMSAYLGTADLCFGPFEMNEPDQLRLVLNIQNIFKEEAGLTDVIDPTAGSYFIEGLTKQMVTRSWEQSFIEA
jgi:hypothetical protein